jgi:hypothetical protein
MIHRNSEERRVFVLGTSEPTELALSYLRSQRISCAGLIDTNGGNDLGRLVWGIPVIGTLADLSRLANQHRVFEIVVPANATQAVPYADLLQTCDRACMRLLKLGLYPTETEDSVARIRTAFISASFGKTDLAEEIENHASVSTVS